jgi:prophage DNA circulation protein
VVAPIYFSASFGGIDLLVASLASEDGRDIAVHSLSRGDRHALQDRGRKLLSVQAELLFADQPSAKADYITRFRAFRDLVNLGEASVFTHPVLGSYLARIGAMPWHLSEAERLISVSCTILAEEEPQAVFPNGAGASSSAGLDAVTAAADAVTAKLAPAGLTSPIPADAVAAATAWSITDAAELDAAVVTAAVTTIANNIAQAIDTYQLATDITRWELYRSFILLAFQMRRAGEAATADSSTVFDVTVGRAQPLRALCARIYGPALAEDRTQQVVKLNRIRTPGLLSAGTVLKMPSDGATP